MKLKEFADPPKDLDGLCGRTVLVSLNKFTPEGEVHGLVQEFGRIRGFEDERLLIENSSSKINRFPYHPEALVLAPHGTYTLVSNGNEIINPDYLLSWRLDLAYDIQESDWTPNSAPHFASIVPREWKFTYAFDEIFIKNLINSKQNTYLGQTVLAGITTIQVTSGQVQLIGQQQIFGTIKRINFTDGVVLQLANAEEFKLPPDLTLLQLAQPGEYELQASGEVVKNPKFITQWRRTIPTNQ
jgi:hypothetical protein